MAEHRRLVTLVRASLTNDPALGDLTGPAERLRAEALDHAWAIEFQSDLAAVGHDLKLRHVVDEFPRERL